MIDGKTENFIRKAIKVHGNRYDYSRVHYRHNGVKEDIICSKHGVFKQSPTDSHLIGRGCPSCKVCGSLAIDNFSNYEDAVEWAINDAFDNGAIVIDETHIIPYHRILGFELFSAYLSNPQSQPQPQTQAQTSQPPQNEHHNKKRGRYYRGQKRHNQPNGHGNSSSPQNVTPQTVTSLTPKSNDGDKRA